MTEPAPESSALEATGQVPVAEVPESAAPARAGDAAVSFFALKHIAVNAAKSWVDHRASSRGAALALYSLFSLAPTLLLVTRFARLFFGENSVRAEIMAQARTLVGDQGAAVVLSLLAKGEQHAQSGIATWVSFGVVLASATTAFAELKDTLDELWQLPPRVGNSIWIWVHERFISIGVLLVLALMLLFSLVASAVLASIDKLLGAEFAQSVTIEAATIASEVFGFAVLVALFASIYKLLPNTQIRWLDVFPGALLTALLFTIGKALIGYYLGHGGVSSGFGAAGSFVALILWVYYSAQIFLYGALLTYEWTFILGSRRSRVRQKARLEYVEVAASADDLKASGMDGNEAQGGESD